MNSDNLKGVIQQFVSRPLPRSRARGLELPLGSGKVIGLAGARRSGKTFLFFRTIDRLLGMGVSRPQLIYLNFEDDRLQPLRAEDLDMILRCHRELFPETIGSRCYLFLDEVQNVPGWERWVRRLHDTEDIEIFVTGSSSHLLTRDLATALRGRSITFEVFPLSFAETLDFRGIVWQPSHPDSESVVRGALEEYLRWGGFPEVVMADVSLRPLILGEYASLMLYRDVVERYGVRNETLMRELLRFAFRNTASLLNVSKLHRDFTSLGFSVSKNTLHEYLGYLEDGFLLFLLPKQERSLRKQAHNPKKMHVIDTGLVAAFVGNPDANVGHKLETAVFLHLRRRHRELFYQIDGSELDLCDADGTAFWNSCWNLADTGTVAREVAAMEMGTKRVRRAVGTLIYHECDPAFLASIPTATQAWRWLLEVEPGLNSSPASRA